MKVAWIFPKRVRCGITIYANNYVRALAARIEVACYDIGDYDVDPKGFISKVNACDIVHIQYDPSFFFNNGSDFYHTFAQRVRPSIVVSLHEVYDEFPDVFPRAALDGPGPISFIKRWRYDRRHPFQTAYRRHAADSFYARKVLVHQEFQATILKKQNVRPDLVVTIPHPVVPFPGAVQSFRPDPDAPLRLAASGFINPHFDYNLLFASLQQLDMPWRFTWIGGVRRDEDEPLLRELLLTIVKSGWRDRFQITGWVDDGTRAEHLIASDIIIALFSARSSSGSLAAAFGALRPVIATPLPLTEELMSRYGILHCVSATPQGVNGGVRRIVDDGQFRNTLLNNVAEYRKKTDIDAMALRLVDVYTSCRA
jgi:hypothetical protein